MSQKDFERFSRFIYEEVGIKLPPSKKVMVEARLQKRMRLLNIPDHTAYIEFLFSAQGLSEELLNLIDVVTTNTTDFFREPQHFEMLNRSILPNWHQRNAGRSLKLWSAGCSIGMEPYTLAMVFDDFAQRNPGFRATILATDISTQCLQTAQKAVYDEGRTAQVPRQLKQRYFLRSKDRSKQLVRVVPELRRMVTFKRLNFMEDFRVDMMDIIFCRNVVIYFDKPTQSRLFDRLCMFLKKGGHLFIGHSESLAGMSLPLQQIAPTVYERI
jgi:chemotaxis protein methyltransferase CheR